MEVTSYEEEYPLPAATAQRGEGSRERLPPTKEQNKQTNVVDTVVVQPLKAVWKWAFG